MTENLPVWLLLRTLASSPYVVLGIVNEMFGISDSPFSFACEVCGSVFDLFLVHDSSSLEVNELLRG
jgi:hypothetical protein